MRGRQLIRFGVLLTAATIVLGLATLPARAQEGYIGASWLSSSADFTVTPQSFSASSDGWKLFGGYNFNKYFGLEATYYDLGNFEDTDATSKYTADVKAYDLAGRGILPIGTWFEMFAKLGFSTVSNDSTLTTLGSPVGVSASVADWEFLYGVGVGFKIGKHFGIRAEWEAWNVEGNLSEYSIGALARF